ncbi:MAG: HAD family hydrolase [Peptoniphilaceae bacterium]|nr:HAD family hydrolase [Peptoniphilaceae bacterium]MDD7383138.1 HAD family hydrolase [Peptoniphilaceae bacterium]MDY3738131.1 HAD family hydrolase [Peptoniphilaceae bacterium]
MIKLFVADLDGTTLDNKGDISKENLNAIEKLNNSGIKLVFASGRVLKSVKYQMNKLGLDNPIIANNGAISMLNDDEIINEYFLEWEQVEILVNYCKENDLNFHFYDKDTFYSNSLNFEKIQHLRIENTNKFQADICISENPVQIVKERGKKVYKFMINYTENNLEKIKSEILKHNKIKDLYITTSGFNGIEIMNNKANKWNSIKDICDLLGFKLNETSAIGDQLNDFDMIKNSEIGFAVENSSNEIKSVANYIVESNDKNGFKSAIEKILEMNRNA